MTLRLHPSRSLSALLAISAAASLIAASGAAFAQDRGPDDLPAGGIAGEVAPDTTADLDEGAYDIPGEIVVDAKDDLDATALAGLASDYGLSFTPTTLEKETHIELANVDASDESALLDRLGRDPRIESAEPLAKVRAFFAPNDPLIKDQWHLERIGASRAWDFATGRGVTVAVVDTGIACETYGPYNKGSDLADTECVGGWNFVASNTHANDDQGHGTHVAGTIAQSTNNGIGAAGVAFHARLMPVKVLNADGWGTTADVADGIRWAAEHGAQVVNLSLGGPRNAKILREAVDFAIAHGTVVVAAAGNTGGGVQYPGATEGVIGVSATDSGDKLAKFSSRGNAVDIAAPGVNVVQQTICNKGRDKCERYPGFSGTSMAAPHVAGAAALMESLGVTDPAAVEAALKDSARVVDPSDGGRKLYGAGILQAAASAERVTFMHVIARMIGLLGFAWLIARGARKRNAEASTRKLSFWIPALAAGPGLFFFAPWVLPRATLAVDLLSRPIADLDFFVGASLHRWLPFANALVPFALTAVFFGSRRIRPIIAGLATGTAAYLGSVAALGEAGGPFGHIALVGWCAVNAVLCAWIARTNLAETK